MGYSVKWVTENLGITRDMLRYYEEKKLLKENDNRNHINYRDYNDADIECLWAIKLLIGIGFTAKEIYALKHDPKFDFNTAIAKKVSELERKHDENLIYLQFAKSIKLTGCVPTTTEYGSIKFDDFLEYSRKNWNFYDDPRTAPFMKVADTLISNPSPELRPDDVDALYEVMTKHHAGEMMQYFALHGYFQVIADMRDFGYDSDTVQRVVKLLYEFFVNFNTDPELDGKITPQKLALHLMPYLIEGDVAEANKRNYSEEGCLFIAKALAYYGGYDVDNL